MLESGVSLWFAGEKLEPKMDVLYLQSWLVMVVVVFSCSVVSGFLQPHGLQHTMLLFLALSAQTHDH